MRVIVDDEKTQTIEVDAYHERQWLAALPRRTKIAWRR
jgi:IS1 family transposase